MAGLPQRRSSLWRFRSSGAERPTLVDSLCLDNATKLYHLAGKLRVEELVLPHLDVMKIPDAVGFETPSSNPSCTK